MSRCYILEGHEVVECDVRDWGLWFESHRAERIVAQEELPDGHRVSTVFIGIDHSRTFDGPPLVFETMVFRPPYERKGMTGVEQKEYREMIGSDPPTFMLRDRIVDCDEVDCERCSTWEEAEEQHARLLRKWRLETTTLRVVNGSED